MKFSQYFASVAMLALMLSVTAFAKDSHSGNFAVADTVQMGTTQLAPGKYKAEWSGPADDVKVDITQNGKTVATTQGKIIDLQRPSPYDAVLTKTLADQTKTINEIDFNNRKQALVLGGM
jgi:hypothetical protein